MIAEETKKSIEKYVDDYISEMRFSFVYLEFNRLIEEVFPGKYLIYDTGLIFDRDQDFNKIIQHPVENTFIPEKLEYVNMEFTIELQLPELTNLLSFDVSGEIQSKEISIEDSNITDENLKLLLESTYFNNSYLKEDPEVRDYLEELYKADHPSNIKAILTRLRPMLLDA